jgi:hypothetical protein
MGFPAHGPSGSPDGSLKKAVLAFLSNLGIRTIPEKPTFQIFRRHPMVAKCKMRALASQQTKNFSGVGSVQRP